jgi:hypothetical protein
LIELCLVLFLGALEKGAAGKNDGPPFADIQKGKEEDEQTRKIVSRRVFS